jgi:hypothetical protein
MFSSCWSHTSHAKRHRVHHDDGRSAARARFADVGGAAAAGEAARRGGAIESLPSDVLALIWSYLPDARDFGACAAACRDWRNAMRAACSINVFLPELREMRCVRATALLWLCRERRVLCPRAVDLKFVRIALALWRPCMTPVLRGSPGRIQVPTYLLI